MIALILPTCGKRKPDTLTGATEVSQVMEAKEEPGILSWMWYTVKDHPYYTAVGVAGFILVGSVASYWCYNKYTKKAAVGYDVGDDPHAYDVQNEVQIIVRGAPPHQEPAPSSDGLKPTNIPGDTSGDTQLPDGAKPGTTGTTPPPSKRSSVLAEPPQSKPKKKKTPRISSQTPAASSSDSLQPTDQQPSISQPLSLENPPQDGGGSPLSKPKSKSKRETPRTPPKPQHKEEDSQQGVSFLRSGEPEPASGGSVSDRTGTSELDPLPTSTTPSPRGKTGQLEDLNPEPLKNQDDDLFKNVSEEDARKVLEVQNLRQNAHEIPSEQDHQEEGFFLSEEEYLANQPSYKKEEEEDVVQENDANLFSDESFQPEPVPQNEEPPAVDDDVQVVQVGNPFGVIVPAGGIPHIEPGEYAGGPAFYQGQVDPQAAVEFPAVAPINESDQPADIPQDVPVDMPQDVPADIPQDVPANAGGDQPHNQHNRHRGVPLSKKGNRRTASKERQRKAEQNKAEQKRILWQKRLQVPSDSVLILPPPRVRGSNISDSEEEMERRRATSNRIFLITAPVLKKEEDVVQENDANLFSDESFQPEPEPLDQSQGGENERIETGFEALTQEEFQQPLEVQTAQEIPSEQDHQEEGFFLTEEEYLANQPSYKKEEEEVAQENDANLFSDENFQLEPEPVPQNEEQPAVGDDVQVVQVGNPFGVIVSEGGIPPDADSDQPDKQPASPNNTYNHLDTIPEDISFADIERRFGDNDEPVVSPEGSEISFEDIENRFGNDDELNII
jgi:hypothetical protein